jgi:hypothetical protein
MDRQEVLECVYSYIVAHFLNAYNRKRHSDISLKGLDQDGSALLLSEHFALDFITQNSLDD